ncbi:MAG: hypothetical protein MK098_05400 [Marinovum sp.]|nr:hypothetical protein [Marinovum sp.]
MIISAIVFTLFGALGLHAALRSQRDVEFWLVLPPVILSVALGAWRVFAGDLATTVILSALLVIFSVSAAGSLVGMAVGRSLARRRRT